MTSFNEQYRIRCRLLQEANVLLSRIKKQAIEMHAFNAEALKFVTEARQSGDCTYPLTHETAPMAKEPDEAHADYRCE